MDESPQIYVTIKAALFVDFDNIYSGLRKIHPKAAEEFATDPARWLAWFEQGMPSREVDGTGPRRRRSLLLRHCYLNPRAFGGFRADFTRSAFKVVDCPPLTHQNKNSTDIHMVMDILDALQLETHFDEFIILSGDSDFTPVLLRLRLYDRRTVILTPGPASQAYKAASDHVVNEDVFIEEGLGLRPERVRRVPAPTTAAQHTDDVEEWVLDAMARKVYERVAADGAVPAASLPAIFGQFPKFRSSSNWLGFYSLIDLTRELTRRRPEMYVAECVVDGNESWELRPSAATPARQEDAAGAPATVAVDGLSEKILARVAELVDASPSPVDMAAAAWDVINNVGPEVLSTQWAGAGSFKDLLRAAGPRGFEIATAPYGSGYLYDPSRHVPPANAVPDPQEKWEGYTDEMLSLARRVGRVTGSPPLNPGEYAVVFKALEDELKEESYFLTSTSRAVRDRCALRGHPLSRRDISFIFKGITYGGHDFEEKLLANTAETFAQVFREQVLKLCKDAQLELSGDEQKLLEQWIRA